MYLLSFDDFALKCNSGFCLRGAIKSPNCFNLKKQKLCYEKYKKLVDKNNNKSIDNNYLEFRRKVWLMDTKHEPISVSLFWNKYCKLTNCLTEIECKELFKNFEGDLWLNRNLDVAHIIPISKNPKLKYDPYNAVVLGRFFHKLLDNYKNPINGKPISIDEREAWLKRAKGLDKARKN